MTIGDRDRQISALLADERVAQIQIREHLEQRLHSDERLRVKFGVDPSRPDLHIGHYVAFRKLRQFQDLGHTVVVIIGDWTAQIGDPTGRSAQRTMLTADEVTANARTYLDQLFKVIDVVRAEIRHQSEWFGGFDLADVLRLTARYSVAQMLQREDFQKRYSAGASIGIVELLYPLLQAYDSVAVHADVEMGGTDQTFNLLVGRDILREYGHPPQDILTVPLLVGLDGVQKMSKSLDNYVGVSEDPVTSFGKLMSVPDTLIERYLRLVTVLPANEIDIVIQQMATGEVNPRDAKALMAHTIVADLHGEAAANAARQEFERVFRDRELPGEIEDALVDLPATIHAVLVATGMAQSNNEARRLVEQGGVRLNDQRVESATDVVQLSEPVILRVGRRRFVRLIPRG
ncbi:MAG TPA: tyrosine--tRNA ligase [Thermomicrobiales bacterium]|nr:tyrosine--tRNA ligase [Thermomicrobiales bacterium]